MSYLLILLGLWLALALLQKLLPKWGANAIRKAAEPLNAPRRQYQTIDVSAYADLDLAWYIATTRRLEARGFVHLEDIIDVEVARTRPTARVFIRSLRSGDEAVVCGLYHFCERGMLRFLTRKILSDVRVCDLETELSDGSFVCTSNAPAATTFDFGDNVVMYRVASPDVEQLLRAHEGAVAERLQSAPNVTVVRSRTAEDVRAFADRLQLAKSRYRRTLGAPITEQELNAVSDGRYKVEAAAVASELESSRKGRSE